LVECEIFDVGYAGFIDQVADFVGAVIHDNPLNAVFRVSLVSKTLEHDGNEGAAIEGGRAYGNERLEILKSGFFGGWFLFSHVYI
jgi:hypothetical protein